MVRKLFSKALINELEKYLFISRIDPMIRFAFVVFLMGFQSLCGVVDFEKEVWPILDKRCVECHKAPYEINGLLKKPKAGLRLDGAAYIMHGGDEGPLSWPIIRVEVRFINEWYCPRMTGTICLQREIH